MTYIGGDAQTSQSTAAWTSATGSNTALSIAVSGFATVAISFQVSGSITAGAVTFELSDAGTNWYQATAYRISSETSEGNYTLTGSNQIWMVPVGGATNFRVRLSTVITGSGTANLGVVATVAPLSLPVVGIGAALPTGSNTIGAITQASGPWTENLTQIGGTAVDTNSGTKSAGTQRVVLATDQPALTNKLLVTPDSVALPAHQSVNVDQLNGTTTDTNSGTKSAGTLRVVLATDQPQLTNALKVDGSAVTQPISDANLELSQASTTSGQKGPLIQGAVTTNAPSYTTGQTDPVSLDTSGLLRISIKDTPQNTNALKVDGSAVTQPVSAASLPLPSGASTAAKQPALGTAGTASSDVITVQGIGSMTALKVDGSGVTQPVSGTVTANAGTGNFATNLAQVNGSTVSTAATGVQKVGLVGNGGATVDSTVAAGSAPTNAVVTGAVYNTSAPAPTNGQAMAHQVDQAGNLRVCSGIALTTLSAWNSGTSVNTTQTIYTNSGANAVLVQLDQTTTITAGAVTFEVSYDGTNWVTIPANCVIDPTSITYGTISVPYTLQASTNKPFILSSNGWQGLRIKLSTAITGTGAVTPYYALLQFDPCDSVIALSPTAANFNVTVGAALPTGTNTIGNVSSVPATSGGLSTTKLISAASTNGTSVKTSAGQIYNIQAFNLNASPRYLKIYNKASSPTVGTDTPVNTFMIPGNTAGAGFVMAINNGLALGTGIAFAITGGIADSDTNAISANEVVVNIQYK